MENRNDADILGVRRGCTFIGYSNANFDSSAGNFVLTSGATDRWQTKKDTMTMSAFHPDGLCLPCHRSLSCSTRQSSRTSASADRILGVTALTLGWDESLGGDNFCGKWHKYVLYRFIFMSLSYMLSLETHHILRQNMVCGYAHLKTSLFCARFEENLMNKQAIPSVKQSKCSTYILDSWKRCPKMYLVVLVNALLDLNWNWWASERNWLAGGFQLSAFEETVPSRLTCVTGFLVDNKKASCCG